MYIFVLEDKFKVESVFSKTALVLMSSGGIFEDVLKHVSYFSIELLAVFAQIFI